jgi:chromosome segregation ATPase
MFSKKVEEFDAQKQQLALQERAINTLQGENMSMRDYQKKYDREYQERTELARKYTALAEEAEAQAKECAARVDRLCAEKEAIASERSSLTHQLSQAYDQIATLKEEFESQACRAERLEAAGVVSAQREQQLAGLRELTHRQQAEAAKQKHERDILQEKMHEILAQNEVLSEKMRTEIERVSSERDSLDRELNELFQEKAEKDIVIKNLTNENLELNSRLNSLEQLLCAKEDQDSRLDQLQEAYFKLTQNKDKYKNDLEMCTNYLLEVEEKCQEAQKTSLELLQQLKERETEIEQLQDLVHQLQINAQYVVPPNVYVYQPVKDDMVDKRLAEYINSAPIRLRDHMRFERESEGIYKYGKKRVFMKIEKD